MTESTSEAAPLNRAGRFAVIDALRAFSVALVVVAHAGLGYIVPGGSGVTLFFTISGFVITYLLIKERTETGSFSARRFYERRAVKILPPLGLLVLLPTLVYSLFHPVSWPAVVSQIFFYFNWFKAAGGADVLPGSGVVWSLSIEEQFYIVWAAVWVCIATSRQYLRTAVLIAALAAAASLTIRVILYIRAYEGSRIYYGTDTRLDGIAIGVLTALLISHLERKRSLTTTPARSSAVLLTAVAIFAVSVLFRDEWFRQTIRYSFQSIAAALVIVYALCRDPGAVRRLVETVASSRIVSLIGLSSYSIYLVHYPLIVAIRHVCGDSVGASVLIPVCVVVSLLAGCLAYLAIEVPVHRWHRARR